MPEQVDNSVIEGILVKYYNQQNLSLEEVKIVIFKYLDLKQVQSFDKVINFLFSDFTRIEEMMLQTVKNNMLEEAFITSINYIEKEYSISKLRDKNGKFIRLV